MKKATFSLAVRLPGSDNTERLAWSGYETDVPGLVVCREPKMMPGAGWKFGDFWQVIHEASGWVIGSYRIHRRFKAVELVTAFGKLGVDWTRSVEVLASDQDLRRSVAAALKEIGL